MRTLDCEAGSKNQKERPSRSTRLPASRGGSTYCSRLRKLPALSSLEKRTKVLCERSCPLTYSVRTSVEREDCSALRTLSVAATISCALCASAEAAYIVSIQKRMVLNMAKCIHDGKARGPIGRYERGGHRHECQHDPRTHQERKMPGQVDSERRRTRVAGRDPTPAHDVNDRADRKREERADCCADGPDERALEQELVAHAPAADAHRTNRADLIGALHDVHGHRVHDGEEDDQAHY